LKQEEVCKESGHLSGWGDSIERAGGEDHERF
jgi:hypothetical protein